MAEAGAPAPSEERPVVMGKYEVGRRIASEDAWTIYAGTNITDGSEVALKVAQREPERRLAVVRQELSALQRLRDQPSIIRLIEYDLEVPMAHPSTGKMRDVAVAVLEPTAPGDLFDIISCTGPLPEPIARYYFRQLLDALRVCHSQGVYHLDVKPENVLVNNDDFALKLSGFSVCQVSEGDPDTPATFDERRGSISYMAPEICRRESYTGGKADMWSAGIVLFITVSGHPPMSRASPGDWWYDRIREGRMDLFWAAHERSSHFSPEFKSLLSRIFADNPDERASLEEVMEDPWMSGEVPSSEEVREEMSPRMETVRAGLASRPSAAVEPAAAPESGGHDVLVAGTADEVQSIARETLEAMGASVEVLSGEADFFLSARFDEGAVGMRLAMFEASATQRTVRANHTEGDSSRFAQLFDDFKQRVSGVEGGGAE